MEDLLIDKHWLTRYDPDDGEPYGVACSCSIGDDHDAAGNLTDPDPVSNG